MRDLLGKYGCDRNATLLVSKCLNHLLATGVSFDLFHQ